MVLLSGRNGEPSASGTTLCFYPKAAQKLLVRWSPASNTQKAIAQKHSRNSRGPVLALSLQIQKEQTNALALYIHWPFCLSRCPYCDFNAHVRETIDQDRWCNALLAELAHWAKETPGRTLTSIFFGGGTPSLMQPTTAAALIKWCRQKLVVC